MARTAVAVAVAFAIAPACTGAIGENDGRDPGAPATDGRGGVDEPGGTSTSAVCRDQVDPGRSPMRRLTRAEFDNTVRELLGETRDLGRAFAPEEESLGFRNNADALQLSPLLAEQIMEAAEKIATAAVARLPSFAPACDVAKDGEDTCARRFVEGWGKRAWRRAITPEETTELLGIFVAGKSGGKYEDGIALVIQRMIQSPFFLYRVEEGDPSTARDGVVRLTGLETATRLSYMIWESPPDAALLADADSGALATAEGVAAAARRMLGDPRAKKAIADFHEQWLELEHLENVTKDATTYPGFDAATKKSLHGETATFLDEVFWKSGKFEDLFTAPFTFMDAKVAAIYGVPAPSGSGFVKVAVDPSKRAGILTQPAVLALHAKPNQSSPVHRGKFVRERILCQQIAPPPNDLVVQAPDPDPKAPTRQRFAEHSANPVCASCHRLMDPIGFGFEHFDGVGRWRDLDGTFTVDASGEVFGSVDADGKFSGATELGAKLAKSEQVRSCVVTQWFRFAYGRGEITADACTMKALNEAFAKSGGDMRELLVALTQTPAFRFRKLPTP